MDDDRCSLRSAALAEPLAGTATGGVTRWLLVEDRRPWAHGGFEDADLPGKAAMKAAIAARPGTRAGLVRLPRVADGVTVWASGPGWLRRLVVAHVDALADVDWGAALDGHLGEPVERMFAVCTHGKRDACCAIEGTRTWTALATAAPGVAWQASHLGGHRFAPCVLVLPESIYYGRVGPEEVTELVAAHARGDLHRLDRVRGRTAWPGPAQAAEVWLREQTGVVRDGAVTLRGVDGAGPWAVDLELDGVAHRVHVWTEVIGQAPQSCGDAPGPVRALRSGAAPAAR